LLGDDLLHALFDIGHVITPFFEWLWKVRAFYQVCAVKIHFWLLSARGTNLPLFTLKFVDYMYMPPFTCSVVPVM
jgi:hypothetical protein